MKTRGRAKRAAPVQKSQPKRAKKSSNVDNSQGRNVDNLPTEQPVQPVQAQPGPFFWPPPWPVMPSTSASNMSMYQPFGYPWPPSVAPQPSQPGTGSDVGRPPVPDAGSDVGRPQVPAAADTLPRGPVTADPQCTVIQPTGPNSNTSGECNITKIIAQPAPPPTPVCNVSENLGINVPQTVKEKIWKGEFVELALLIKKDRKPDPVGFKVEEDGGLLLQAKQEKDIKDIFVWTTAFHILMAIVLEKESHRAIEMLRYIERVRCAARDFPGDRWVEYDRQARLKQARDPSRSWATFDGDLWLTILSVPAKNSSERATTSSNNTKADASPKPSQTGTKPKDANIKACVFFNREKCMRGSACQFEHRCSQCSSKLHPKTKCPLPPKHLKN